MNQLIQSLQRVPASELTLWAVVALLALAVIAFLVRAEGQHFRRLGLGSAWLKLRIATLPILAIALVAVIAAYSVTGIGGPEALAVAYLALFTVGPLAHFGLHMLLGRVLGLTRGQAAWIAFSGLLMIGSIPAVAGMVMPYLHSAVHAWRGSETSPADATPLAPSPYQLVTARRLTLPNQEEVWAMHYQAQAGTRLVRIDVQTNDYLVKDMLHVETATMCRRDQDLHLMWPADRPLPLLHVFWKDAAGQELKSSWTLQAPGTAAEPFVVSWEAATLRLPAAIARSALSLSWERKGGSPWVSSLQEINPGTDCAPPEIALSEMLELGRPNGLRLRIDHTLPKGPTWADFRRPEIGLN
jgi:hypothetical protein